MMAFPDPSQHVANVPGFFVCRLPPAIFLWPRAVHNLVVILAARSAAPIPNRKESDKTSQKAIVILLGVVTWLSLFKQYLVVLGVVPYHFCLVASQLHLSAWLWSDSLLVLETKPWQHGGFIWSIFKTWRIALWFLLFSVNPRSPIKSCSPTATNQLRSSSLSFKTRIRIVSSLRSSSLLIITAIICALRQLKDPQRSGIWTVGIDENDIDHLAILTAGNKSERLWWSFLGELGGKMLESQFKS